MAGLNKEVWINQVMEKFYPDTSFLKYVRDFTQLAENDTINLADAGVDPAVLVNNTAYPIVVNERVDTPISIELDKFETENTVVRRPDVVERAYDMLESVVMGHRSALRTITGAKAAWSYAPQSNTTFTPVLQATGPVNSAGRHALQIEDILALKTRYDDVDYPLDKRYLVLCPMHSGDIMAQDFKSFKNLLDIKDGQPQRFAGFGILQFSRNAYYTSGLVKKPYGTALAGTDGVASFSFYGDEVMKADGTMWMYDQLNDPRERGTIIGFDKRFIALSIRNKGIGAIVSLP